MTDGKIVEAYFEAWNQHDAPTIMATFNEGGRYTDSEMGQSLYGDAIGSYAQRSFDAFPDLVLDLISKEQLPSGRWVAPWVLRDITGDGSMAELIGYYVMTLRADKIDVAYRTFNFLLSNQVDPLAQCMPAGFAKT